MTERETFRLAPPVIFWWVWLAFVALNLVDDLVQGVSSPRLGAVVWAILFLVTGLAYTLALRPRVVTSGDEVTVVNPYRTHRVPWRLITAVDTGNWVQLHYATVTDGDGASDPDLSSAGGRTLPCWGLYVSVRAKRKIAAGPPRPRAQRSPGGRGLGGLGRGFGWGGGEPGATAGYASARLPEEARYLASLPPVKAIAVRLDTQADRERARAAGRELRSGNRDDRPAARTTWSWTALTAVVVPALIALAVILA